MGVEVGGAVKNVIAIGSGIADGMGFGANTRVALDHARPRRNDAPRRQSSAPCAKPSWDSRVSATSCSPAPTINRATGASDWRWAAGSRSDAERSIDQVVEGVRAARAVRNVAGRLAVDMPICAEVYRVMYEGKPVRAAVQALMERAARSETE